MAIKKSIQIKLREKLEAYLISIFGSKKVIFDLFSEGKEQAALFCDIDESQMRYSTGKVSYYVTGSLSIGVAANLGYDGYLHDKYEAAHDTDDLTLGSGEVQIKYQENNTSFIKYSVSFTYTTTAVYNPPSGKMESCIIE